MKSSTDIKPAKLPLAAAFAILLLFNLPAGGQNYVLSPLQVGSGADVQGQQIPHPAPPKVPDKVVFAGDTIRFDRPDLVERMDRELIAFTYMHANTTLMLKRSRRYFNMVVPILRKYGVPEDLKYLMAIESNLDPKAVSNVGAAGLWQFMKGTGQAYGLEINSEVDERYHIEKATAAACRYLKEALRKYGDWMTVAASYNAGQGGVSKRREDQRQKSALDLWLPEETSRYMFRILAAKMLFENPERFGYSVGEGDYYPEIGILEEVEVAGKVDSLADWAIAHGTTYARLKEANLWLRDSKLTNKQGKSYTVKVPEARR